MIKIDFEYQTKFGKFADALHLPDDHGMTAEQIEDMKAQRLANWLAIVDAPQVDADIQGE